MDFFSHGDQLVADFGGRNEHEMGIDGHRAVTGQIGSKAESTVGNRKECSSVQAAQKVGHCFSHRHDDRDTAGRRLEEPDTKVVGVAIRSQKGASPLVHTASKNAWKMRLEVRARYGSAASRSRS